jgi:hypothetical protein
MTWTALPITSAGRFSLWGLGAWCSNYSETDDTAKKIGYFIGDLSSGFICFFVAYILLVQFVRF